MSFPAYESYKDSGVDWLGRLPSTWAIKRFRFLFEESAEKIESEVVGPMLSVSGYRGIEVKQYDDENRRRLDEELVGYRIVRPGQLVVNTMWLNYAGLGISDFEGHVSPAYRSYFVSGQLEGRYIHHLMRSELYVKGYTRLLTGIRPNSLQMSREDLMDFPIIVPPKAEQRAIAAFLDRETAKIDALVEAQERLIELLKEKRQAVISHAVTKGLDPSASMKDSNVEWLGHVPAHWEVIQIRRVVRQFEQGWSPECYARPADGHEWGVLKTGCVNGGVYRDSENKALPDEHLPRVEYEVRPGDVLMSRASGSPDLIGSVAQVLKTRGRVLLSDKIFRLQFEDDLIPAFGVWAFSATSMRSQIVNAISGAEGMANNLPQARIKEFWLAKPPRSEQLEIVDALSALTGHFDRLTERAEAAITLLQERRAALMSAAVTGKIDVRGLVQTAEAA